jgi:hypothetical protein
MKTPMQELVDFFDIMIKNKPSILLSDVVDQAYFQLNKEKEQFVNFFIWLRVNSESYMNMSIEQLVEEYYNQKAPELLHKDGTPMRKVKLEAQELLD